ncbi:Rad1-domain-containing protein [Saitoella complicata NRRL Y-17804]|uniref:Rad1-domain-containing protein n=1 Tax=Saitoella complicata (strain BCRC 22490 / CBS 7301 / JCM 7358 / NBRC 10748 / NRRL Y-17804) TaxID=698492 RepID=UPI000867DE09|nr:Rad1-domain-containing protein [Saitoella complicata NRRL Y-17804]ODQ55904.1 Rad1-domain-containing protein [Saitoella complicata NRRL Y-17804]
MDIDEPILATGDVRPPPPTSMRVLNCVSTNITPLLTVLRSIGFMPRALVRISSSGMKFSVENSRAQQALAFLDKTMFSTYEYVPPIATSRPSTAGSSLSQEDEEVRQPHAQFTISLSAMLECLQIFSADARDRPRVAPQVNATDAMILRSGTCRMVYEGEGSSFILMMEEGGVVTTCELTTYEPEEQLDISLAEGGLAQKIIMKAEWLHDAIQELETTSPEVITIRSSPRRPHFRLSSRGSLGSTEMDYPNDRTVLETFICPELIENSYRFTMIRHAIKAMSLATKVSVRADEDGVMSMQFMIDVGEGHFSFVDFRFLPELEDENERGNESTQL